ncbi:YjcZ family sporulation protein [Bacillus coahuilensis]|nr:YjcZ family sporulation protein [Bacillus coahuilensis]
MVLGTGYGSYAILIIVLFILLIILGLAFYPCVGPAAE